MSFTVGFKITGVERSSSGFARLRAALFAKFPSMLDQIGKEVVGTVREKYLSGPRPQHLGRVSGNLASLTVHKVEGNSVTIGNNLPYGRIWEEGGTIPAHTIRPKNGRYLVFQMHGQTVFARMVKKPARTVKARPYLEPGLMDSAEQVREIAQFFAADAVAEVFPGGTA